MGLFYIKQVEGNSLLGLWEMDDAIESMANALLTIPDQSTVQSLKRKKEYITTRLLMDAMYAGTEINYHESGKPYLVNSDTNISISHSKNLVCILLNKSNSIGVDVQYISERINRLKEKFLSDTELSQLPESNKTEALHIYWCAKEALYKMGGQEYADFKKCLHVHPFKVSNEGKIKGTMRLNNQKSEVQLWYEKTGDYFLVYTID